MGRQTVVASLELKQKANGIYSKGFFKNKQSNELDWGGTFATLFVCIADPMGTDYEGPNFLATLDTLSEQVGGVGIVLTGAAIRHTLAREPQHEATSEADRKAIGIRLADAWLERNQTEINTRLGDKLKFIKRWDNFLVTSSTGISMLNYELPAFKDNEAKDVFIEQQRQTLEALLNLDTREDALAQGLSIPGIPQSLLPDYLKALDSGVQSFWHLGKKYNWGSFKPKTSLKTSYAQIIRRHCHEEALHLLMWDKFLENQGFDSKSYPDGNIIPYGHDLTKAMIFLVTKLVHPKNSDSLCQVHLKHQERVLSSKGGLVSRPIEIQNELKGSTGYSSVLGNTPPSEPVSPKVSLDLSSSDVSLESNSAENSKEHSPQPSFQQSAVLSMAHMPSVNSSPPRKLSIKNSAGFLAAEMLGSTLAKLRGMSQSEGILFLNSMKFGVSGALEQLKKEEQQSQKGHFFDCEDDFQTDGPGLFQQ